MFPLDFSLKTEVFVVNLLTIFLVTNAMTDIGATNYTDLTTTEPNDEITEFDGVTENPTEKGVIVLTNETFYSHIANGSHFVLFYEPWCIHTQRFEPTWEQLAESLKIEDISFAKFDCEPSKTICNEFDIRSYPSLIWIEDGRKVEKYSGRRKEKDLTRYVGRMLQQGVFNPEEEDDG